MGTQPFVLLLRHLHVVHLHPSTNNTAVATNIKAPIISCHYLGIKKVDLERAIGYRAIHFANKARARGRD